MNRYNVVLQVRKRVREKDCLSPLESPNSRDCVRIINPSHVMGSWPTTLTNFVSQWITSKANWKKILP